MQKYEKFGITNPLSLLLQKDKSEFTREDLLKAIEDFEIERIKNSHQQPPSGRINTY